ncbi:MAG: hypothetical protein II230_09175, partial [Clostridia bacterium]|nr:hypothetical protein [Clostridia bacterium]
MKTNRKMKKIFSLLLCLCVLLQTFPLTALAAQTDNLCEHHTAHSLEDCGYDEAAEAPACSFVCNACAAAEPAPATIEPEPCAHAMNSADGKCQDCGTLIAEALLVI